MESRFPQIPDFDINWPQPLTLTLLDWIFAGVTCNIGCTKQVIKKTVSQGRFLFLFYGKIAVNTDLIQSLPSYPLKIKIKSQSPKVFRKLPEWRILGLVWKL